MRRDCPGNLPRSLSIFWLKNLHLDLDDNSGGCMVEVLINECSLCSMMEDVKVNIGELFQDLEHWDDKKKMSECQTKAGNQITLSHSHSRHTGQLLFSCLCSKVTLSLSHSLTLTLSHSLIYSLSTCWTTFVFISMLKTHCLLLKIAMLFFGHPPHPPHPLLLV